TPAELERIVLHALAKDPRARPADANEFRRELHTVAVDLGLEYSDSTLSPSLADLRSAGTESPSGRLVINLATLRQVQAASSGESLSAAAVRERAALDDATVSGRQRREFGRVNVPLENASAGQGRSRYRL